MEPVLSMRFALSSWCQVSERLKQLLLVTSQVVELIPSAVSALTILEDMIQCHGSERLKQLLLITSQVVCFDYFGRYGPKFRRNKVAHECKYPQLDSLSLDRYNSCWVNCLPSVEMSPRTLESESASEAIQILQLEGIHDCYYVWQCGVIWWDCAMIQ